MHTTDERPADGSVFLGAAVAIGLEVLVAAIIVLVAKAFGWL